MQVERLQIENFAGIDQMEFEFRSINILIGPQGAGKSITVKLLFFFKNFIHEFIRSIENEQSKWDLDRSQLATFTNYFPKESWGKGNFRISYSTNAFFITIKRTEKSIKLEYSKVFKSLLLKGRKIFEEERIKNTTTSRKSPSFRAKMELLGKIQNCIREELGENTTFEQHFIPAGRSFFANIQSGIFSFLSDNRSLDPFLIEFGSSYENLKRVYNLALLEDSNDKEFTKLATDILNGTYLREKGKDYLIHKDSRKINLANSSSGQQETLPLIIILATLNLIYSHGKGFTLYIEEPEAHLFPNAQRKIVQLLAKTFNNNSKANFQFFITTHSPYLISCFNNLIYAGNIVSQRPDASSMVANIIPTSEQLDHNLFSVYSLSGNKANSIFDSETSLIFTNDLDRVSGEIALEFDTLLDIEFKK